MTTIRQPFLFTSHSRTWISKIHLQTKPQCRSKRFYYYRYVQTMQQTCLLLPTPILNQSITPSYTVLNLGVIFDSEFNFTKHISLTCRCCCFQQTCLSLLSFHCILSLLMNFASYVDYEVARFFSEILAIQKLVIIILIINYYYYFLSDLKTSF